MPRLHTRIPPTCVQIFFLFVIPDFELHEIVVLNYTSPLPRKIKTGIVRSKVLNHISFSSPI